MEQLLTSPLPRMMETTEIFSLGVGIWDFFLSFKAGPSGEWESWGLGVSGLRTSIDQLCTAI